jgi:hypothetical protein
MVAESFALRLRRFRIGARPVPSGPYRAGRRRAATSGGLIRDVVGTAAYDSPPAVPGCSWELNP